MHGLMGNRGYGSTGLKDSSRGVSPVLYQDKLKIRKVSAKTMSSSLILSSPGYTYVSSPQPSRCRILSWDIPSPSLPIAADRNGGYAFALHALPPTLTLYAFLESMSEEPLL